MRFDSRGLVSTYLSQWMPTGDVTRQSVAGYWMAGYSGGYLTSGEKFNFASQTNAATANALPAGAQQSQSGSSNSGVAGYFAGGEDSGGKLDRINRIAFPAETRSTLSAVLSTATSQSSGFADCGVF